MATKMTESRHLYSWWWDSHISPKNSKWLQENLTDTDGKVKAMIKIINEDADSFARRAEMYYRKRPELMKLVEDFYRAYRALAERYDHATGELRLAHRTMIEAFPNQMPFMLSDEPPSPVTPHLDEIFDPDDLKTASSDVGFSKKGLKQLHEMFQSGEATLRELKTAEGRLRSNTQGEEDKDSSFKVVSTLLSERNHGLDLRTMILNESEKAAKVEAELQRLKQALAKMEAERDAVLAQYHQSLEKLSNLEKELCSAQADAEELEKCGNEAQSEVKALKESLQKLEVERDSSLQKLEVMIAAAETESRDLKQELSRSESEKQDAIAHYQLSLEKISALEERLRVAEENAKRLSEQNLQAGSEIKALKEEISRLNKEKEDAYLHYQHCLEMISKLQNELMEAKEEVRRLKGAEDQCALLEEVNQSLKLEANELVQEIAVKDQRLLEKHAELEKLTIRLQDEQTRFMQVESALHTLQNMHFQSQEEQRGLADEFRDGIRVLKDVEISKRDMQHEILGLKEIKEKLEAEVTRQAEQNEALQQQFSQLKQELEDLLQQVESAGIDPNCIKSSIKDLQDEKTEKEALLKRLESSLSDVKSELQSSKEKMKALQELCNTLGGEKSNLMAEKSALLSQLQIITESMQKLLEKNVSLETSLQSANIELEGLRVKSKGLGDFCNFLKDEKSNLQTERSNLVYRLECVEKKLEKLETRFTRLEDKYAGQVEELRVSLVLEKKAMKDMEDRDYTLLAECHEHVEAAKYSEKLISKLESENMMQQLETEYLLDRVDTFKRGIFQVLKALEIDHVSEADPEIFLPRIRGSIIEIRRSLSESKDENQELLIQNNVLSAVMKELGSDGVELKARKEAADNEFFILNQQLQREHSGILKANRFLQDKLTRLEEEKHMLEEENSAAIVEALSLSNQSVVFKSSWIETVMELGEKLAMREAENMQLRELTQQLEEKRIKTVQDTNTELYKAVASQESLEQKIFELSACKEHQEKEIVLLQEANGSLENEVSVLAQEIEACKVREVVLNSELHKISSEFELWEAEATSFYFDLQMSSVREALLENKVQELSGLCEDLQSADTRRIMEIERLKNRISFLESDREGFKIKLAAYVPAINSLMDNIASLEQTPALQTKACCPATPQKQVAEIMVDESQSKSANAKEQSSSVSDGLSELQNLQSRIKAIESVVVEKNSVQESIQTNIKHEATTTTTTTKVLAKQKSRNNSQQPNSMIHDAERKTGSLHNRSRELELRNGIHMKDIPLDHVSASPPTIKRRKSSRLSDQMLELWEASDKTPRPRCSPPRRKCSDSNNSGEIEKELGVDLGFQQGGNKRKTIILERLASDAQKLASLQISVQELRRKMEMNKKSKAAKEIEFKSLKSQIYSVESSVVQLVSMNTELTKTVKGSASSLDAARSRELADVEQALRRKMLEQARRDSERIENLQVEMQKMESLLVKMDDEKKGGKSGLLRSQTGIILREFVYGRSRSRKQKKPRFCGCFRQSHKEV